MSHRVYGRLEQLSTAFSHLCGEIRQSLTNLLENNSRSVQTDDFLNCAQGLLVETAFLALPLPTEVRLANKI